MDSCPECDAGVLYRYLGRTTTHHSGYAYLCIVDPEHVYFEKEYQRLVG